MVGLSDAGHRVERNTNDISEVAHRMEMMIGNMSRMFEVVQSSMPTMMGHIWEGDQDQMPILLEDALGRVVHLPLMLCHTKEVCRHHVMRQAGG